MRSVPRLHSLRSLHRTSYGPWDTHAGVHTAEPRPKDPAPSTCSLAFALKHSTVPGDSSRCDARTHGCAAAAPPVGRCALTFPARNPHHAHYRGAALTDAAHGASPFLLLWFIKSLLRMTASVKLTCKGPIFNLHQIYKVTQKVI